MKQWITGFAIGIVIVSGLSMLPETHEPETLPAGWVRLNLSEIPENTTVENAELSLCEKQRDFWYWKYLGCVSVSMKNYNITCCYPPECEQAKHNPEECDCEYAILCIEGD